MNREVGLGFHSLSHSFPVPNKPHDFPGRKAPSKRKSIIILVRAQELCQSQGGRPGLPVPNSTY